MFHIVDLKIFGATKQNLVVRMTWHPEILKPFLNPHFHSSAAFRNEKYQAAFLTLRLTMYLETELASEII
jgi:hypothetical protein